MTICHFAINIKRKWTTKISGTDKYIKMTFRIPDANCFLSTNGIFAKSHEAFCHFEYSMIEVIAGPAHAIYGIINTTFSGFICPMIACAAIIATRNSCGNKYSRKKALSRMSWDDSNKIAVDFAGCMLGAVLLAEATNLVFLDLAEPPFS